MFKEAIEKILGLHTPEVRTVGGKEYSLRTLEPVMEPCPATAGVTSLQALVDLLKCGALGDKPGLILHVKSPGAVCVLGRDLDTWGRRSELARATLEQHTDQFHFGHKYSPEPFIIALQSAFVDNTDRKQILAITGNLRMEQVQTSQDDGVTQQVAVKAGVQLKEKMTIPNPVMLAPYRTFREVQQPESPFIFRAHSCPNDLPTLSLTEADGGAWKLKAIANVAGWLRAELEKSGLKDVPVIA